MSEKLFAGWAETELGRFLVATTGRGLAFVHLDAARAEADLDAWRRRHADGAQVAHDAQAVRGVTQALEGYARGERRDLDLSLDLRGTPFQRSVWAELLRIPFGATRTYAEIARRLGKPNASRAVGAANGANPIPIVVPCHRVVGRGGLCGFGGGLDLKRRLLALEGALLPL